LWFISAFGFVSSFALRISAYAFNVKNIVRTDRAEFLHVTEQAVVKKDHHAIAGKCSNVPSCCRMSSPMAA